MRTIDNIRRFRLSDTFIDHTKKQKYRGVHLGTLLLKERTLEDLNEFDPEAAGTEEWWQTCRRVVEGMFNMQKQHVFMPWV